LTCIGTRAFMEAMIVAIYARVREIFAKLKALAPILFT